VAADRAALEELGAEIVEADLLAADGALIRHDPAKLAAAVLGLGRGEHGLTRTHTDRQGR
jgi:hypothetical protein